MEFFKLDAVEDWHPIVPNELLAFSAEGSRRVRLSIISNADCEVWVSLVGDDPDTPIDRLVGFGRGMFNVEYSVVGESAFRILADADAAIFMRGYTPDQRVPESELESFTSVEPRSRRNSELDRMMVVVNWNARQNELRLQAERQAMEARFEEVMAAVKPPEPAPAPAPEPAPVPENGGNDGKA